MSAKSETSLFQRKDPSFDVAKRGPISRASSRALRACEWGSGLPTISCLRRAASHPLKVSASEHRAVANGRDERRIEKRVRGGRRKTKRRSMTQQNPPHVGGVITSEGWSKRPKMSFKNQISYRAGWECRG